MPSLNVIGLTISLKSTVAGANLSYSKNLVASDLVPNMSLMCFAVVDFVVLNIPAPLLPSLPVTRSSKIITACRYCLPANLDSATVACLLPSLGGNGSALGLVTFWPCRFCLVNSSKFCKNNSFDFCMAWLSKSVSTILCPPVFSDSTPFG